MENKSKAIVALSVVLTIMVFFIGRSSAPETVCPELEPETITIVEYRESPPPDTVYITATVIGTPEPTVEGEVFKPEILRVDTTLADSARLELTINEATNLVAIEYTQAPIKIREITIETIVTEIKEVPTPISRKGKVQLVAIGVGIGIVVSAILILSSGV